MDFTVIFTEGRWVSVSAQGELCDYCSRIEGGNINNL